MHRWERVIVYSLLFGLLIFNVYTGIMVFGVQDRLVAREISLINKDDIEVIKMGTSEDGGRIVINDSMGVSRLGFLAEHSSIYIMVEDYEGMIPIHPGLSIVGGVDGTRSQVIVGAAKTGGFVVNYNKYGFAPQLILSVESEGGVLRTYNNHSIIPQAVIAADSKSGSIKLYNQYGNNLMSLEQTDEGHGGLWLFDNLGDAIQYYGQDENKTD